MTAKGRRGRWLFWGLWGALALLVIAVALRPDPVWVDLAEATRGPLEEIVGEEGRTRVQDRYRITAPVAGFLHRPDLEVGDRVHAGDRLALLDPLPASILDARARAEAEARLKAAQSALMSARQQVAARAAEAAQARQELERLRILRDRGRGQFVSEDAWSRARAAADRAGALLRSARFEEDVRVHELAAARTRLEISAAREQSPVATERLEIRSPVAAAVLSVLRESEGIVPAGEPIVELGDPSALEVVVDVLSFDAVKLQAGGDVRLSGWGGPLLAGVIRRVEPVGFEDVSALGVEERRVRVVVDITSPPVQWQSLGDGYRVDASFVLWSSPDVLQVPASAIFTHRGQPVVFLESGGRAVLQPVETGHSDGLHTEILSGLAAGDRVVRHPDRQLEDGVRVRWR